jgi:2-dehydro-3-deoxygalactonokinase
MEHVPVVISGMASSSLGILEVPYKQIPFNISEPNLNVKTIEGSKEFSIQCGNSGRQFSG